MISDMDNILRLLAATIFVDKRVYEDEVTALVSGAQQLSAAGHMDPDLSDDKIMTWYEANKDGIREETASPFFKDWLSSLLDELSHVENKASILAVMKVIAKSDGQFHISERTLVAFAERYWETGEA